MSLLGVCTVGSVFFGDAVVTYNHWLGLCEESVYLFENLRQIWGLWMSSVTGSSDLNQLYRCSFFRERFLGWLCPSQVR